jgi:hypothetical protein
MPNETVALDARDLRYGITSHATWTPGHAVNEQWAQDLVDLGVGRVRVDARWGDPFQYFPEADICPNEPEHLFPDFRGPLIPLTEGLKTYSDLNIQPIVILGGGILPINVADDFRPGGIGTCGDPPRDYITAFAARAGIIAGLLWPARVAHFQVWNEPNLPMVGSNPNPEYIADPADFAELVYRAAQQIRLAVGTGTTIITGGITEPPRVL